MAFGVQFNEIIHKDDFPDFFSLSDMEAGPKMVNKRDKKKSKGISESEADAILKFLGEACEAEEVGPQVLWQKADPEYTGSAKVSVLKELAK